MSVQITTELVKELRDATGISVMQCRKALEEAEGDMEKALAILKKTSSEVALKKKDREVKDGGVAIKMANGKAYIVALLCETDFVAKSDDFKALLENLSNVVAAEGANALREKAQELINPVVQKTGENIQLGDVIEVDGAVLGGYVHSGKKAVLVSLSGGDEALAKDVAMHVAAMNPEYVTKEEITDDARKLMQEIFAKEVAESDKPEEVKKKMLEGKMNTYFKEKTLLEQTFIKNPDVTVAKLLEGAKAQVKEVKKYYI